MNGDYNNCCFLKPWSSIIFGLSFVVEVRVMSNVIYHISNVIYHIFIPQLSHNVDITVPTIFFFLFDK
jgi:hypothetical protein